MFHGVKFESKYKGIITRRESNLDQFKGTNYSFVWHSFYRGEQRHLSAKTKFSQLSRKIKITHRNCSEKVVNPENGPKQTGLYALANLNPSFSHH